jgi:hypothetical protein
MHALRDVQLNLLARPRVFKLDTWKEGEPILKAFAELHPGKQGPDEGAPPQARGVSAG